MRNAFAKQLEVLAEANEKMVFLTGDLGNRLFNSYRAKFSNRFVNCGVAESNMNSVAAGLAASGLRPVTYSIAPFNTTRSLEQIKVDICFHNLPVMVVGIGAGLSYASLGGSHHACEDIAIMRALPNMSVVCPGDILELESLFSEAINYSGPIYFRLGKKGERIVHQTMPNCKIGQALEIREGKQIALFTTGNTLPLAVDVAEKLKQEGLSVAVISMHTVKPLDAKCLQDASKRFNHWVSIEEHSLIGGLGSALSEWLIDHDIKLKLQRFGTPDHFLTKVGSQDYVREICHLDEESIVQSILASVYKQESSLAHWD